MVMAAQTDSLPQRLIGALRLDAETYERIEADTSATTQAALIVVNSSLFAAAGNALLRGGDLGGGIFVALAEPIGGAAIDRHGNLNTTAIGADRARPTVQLPGSGGGADIASLAGRLIVIMPHDKRRLRERVDFITSPGYGEGGDWRTRVGLPRGGPAVLITTLGVFRFEGGEAVLVSYHPASSVDEIAANTGWTLTVADDVRATEPPTAQELRIIREYDPQGFWTRRGAD